MYVSMFSVLTGSCKRVQKTKALAALIRSAPLELVNFGRSVWLDHSRPRSLVVALFSPGFSRSPYQV
jgi:hypothetical protein